jgi:thiol:disulfide interchange protein DsbC
MCTTAEARSQVTAQVQRNVAWGQKHRVQGTPAIFFEDGKRVPGGMSLQGLQRQLQSSAKSTVVE